MKRFFNFVIKETRHILRDKRTMLILFGMPVVMMLLFGFAVSNDVRNVRTIIVTSQMTYQTQRIAQAIDASSDFYLVAHVATPAQAERMIRAQEADVAVVFYDDRVQLIVDGADPNMAQQYSSYLTQIIASQGEQAFMAQLVPLTSLLYNPQMKSAYNFVPGIMGMLLMLICALMTSLSIVREKECGTMEVLLVSPVRPLMIIVAKVVPYLILAFLVLIVILLLSKYVLGVPLSGSPFWILSVSTVYIIVALSLGMLISTIAKTQLVALLSSAMLLLLPVVMLSGMLFPIESMPEVLQWISAVLPPRYYVAAMRKLMIMGTGIDSVLHELTILSIMAIVLLTIALANFNKRLDV